MVSLVARYFFSQGISRRSIRNFHPGLIGLAADLNHAEWGYYLRDYIRGKDVLDLGCGHTLYGIGFLIYGARNYLGIDPKLKLDVAEAAAPRALPHRARREPMDAAPSAGSSA